MQTRQSFYEKIGGDITFASQRLAAGFDALGVIAILYRGKNELAEIGINLAPNLKFGASEFKGLTQKILEDCYSESIQTPNRGCQMLSGATGAEDVILFVIRDDGAVTISVSRPQTTEVVAAMALGIALQFEGMN